LGDESVLEDWTEGLLGRTADITGRQLGEILNSIALGVRTTELQDVTCHMGSHSVTCHPTQVNAPRLTPASKAGTRFTYPGGMEG